MTIATKNYKMPEIITSPDSEQSAKRAGEFLSQQLQQYKDKSILLLVAGGSALDVFRHIDSSALGSHITIAPLDERFSADPKVNNFLQIKEKIQSVHMINTVPFDEESLEDFTARYEQALKIWRKENQDGKIIATMGIGEDGHIMGVFPYPEDPEYFRQTFEATERWVVGYDCDNKNLHPLRATATLAFARRIDHAFVYVCGEEKLETLRRTLKSEGLLEETPARIIHEMPRVFLFTDQNVSV